MSEMIKTCPCGAENGGDAAFCTACGQPILDLVPRAANPPTEESPTRNEPSIPITNTVSTGKKVCPVCGTVNESFAVICEGPGCANDLMGVAVSGETPREPESETPVVDTRPRLMLSVGTQKFECRDGDVIGREGSIACQIFSGIGTVSRRHVEIRRGDTEWSLIALAHVQNITQLDGIEMKRGESLPLSGSHKLRMSTQCEVELKIEQPEQSS